MNELRSGGHEQGILTLLIPRQLLERASIKQHMRYIWTSTYPVPSAPVPGTTPKAGTRDGSTSRFWKAAGAACTATKAATTERIIVEAFMMVVCGSLRSK